MSRGNWNYRDVSLLLQKLRDILLGRKHNLHGRFPPLMASRTIPTPDIPRGPDSNYAKRYYFQRNAIDSVKPPVIAPVAEGQLSGPDPKRKHFAADSVCFSAVPTPGTPWWWDGHCYYECIPDPPPPKPICPPPYPPPKDDKCKQSAKPCPPTKAKDDKCEQIIAPCPPPKSEEDKCKQAKVTCPQPQPKEDKCKDKPKMTCPPPKSPCPSTETKDSKCIPIKPKK